MSRLYADHNAASPLLEAVKHKLEQAWVQPFGNPSATHALGRQTRAAIDAARASILRLTPPGELTFTASATEANALALYGHAAAAKREGKTRVVVSPVEHPSVLENAKRLTELGFTVDHDLHNLDGAGVCALMWVNNETGLVQPIAEQAARCLASGVRFHVDAVQALGKLGPLVCPPGVDTLSFSAHKIGGLAGVGALLTTARRPDPWLPGGGQEKGLRGGTENVHGIMAFGWAADEWVTHGEAFRHNMRIARDAFEAHLSCDHQVIQGPRVPNTSDVVITAIRAEALVTALDLDGLAVSHGAACATGSLEPSHALLAMGLSADEARATVRVSFGPHNGAVDGQRAAELVNAAVKRLQSR